LYPGQHGVCHCIFVIIVVEGLAGVAKQEGNGAASLTHSWTGPRVERRLAGGKKEPWLSMKPNLSETNKAPVSADELCTLDTLESHVESRLSRSSARMPLPHPAISTRPNHINQLTDHLPKLT
jgi:hypothetical protein